MSDAANPALARAYPISVVIPTHNSARELERCLEALGGNDLTNVEVLIVDDGSTDTTARVVDSLKEKHERLQARVQYASLSRRSGPAAARNEGLKRARNPYLFFVDADVILQPRSIERIRESLNLYSHRSDVAGVLGCYSEDLPWDDFLTNFKNLSVCFLYQRTDTLSPYLHTPIFCVKREVLEEAGGFDPKLSTAEDFRLGIVLGSKGYRFVIDRKIRGTHLKRYTLKRVLKEDWRRISDLRKIRLNDEQRRFALKAHRLHRLLSLALPGPVVFFGGLSVVHLLYGWISILLLLMFYGCNLPFLSYAVRKKGISFALKSALFMFAEMLWAALCLCVSVVRKSR